MDDQHAIALEAAAQLAAEAAWLAHRDQRARENPWCDQRRLARQMRKRDFVAGYLAAARNQTGVS